jgi:D-arginine dehydrogenase
MLIVAAPGDEHVLADHASPSRHAVDLAAVTDLFPAARPERIGAALFDPTVADIDVAEAVAARGRALVERKVVRRWGEALVRGGRVGSSWRIETTAQTWWADEIVDAAGAWGDAVAESCGIATIGLRPLRRTACTFRASSELMHERWPLLSDARETWYLKPEPGQFLASPADETPSLPSDTRPEETDVAITLDRVRENTSLDPRSITSAWAGLRTFAPDRGLVIGRDAAEPSFVWCVGQGGFGIQTSPAVARAARDLLRTGTISPELSGRGLDASSVSPARFGR